MSDAIKLMYAKPPGLVLGFHGCNRETYEDVLYNGGTLKNSTNSYDWLGNGIYFWENGYERAVEWAKNRFGKEGRVIGAAMVLGYCLDLTDYGNIEIFRLGFELLKQRCEQTGTPLPENRQGRSKTDILLRDLDCAVIQQIHDYNEVSENIPYDSVRGTFSEGELMYEGSAFRQKTHTQICIINPNCIKGYFTPLQADAAFHMP